MFLLFFVFGDEGGNNSLNHEKKYIEWQETDDESLKIGCGKFRFAKNRY